MSCQDLPFLVGYHGDPSFIIVQVRNGRLLRHWRIILTALRVFAIERESFGFGAFSRRRAK